MICKSFSTVGVKLQYYILIIIAKAFSEYIDATGMFGVFFDADPHFNRMVIVQGQIHQVHL